MGELINFPLNDQVGFVGGRLVRKPRSAQEFVDVIKKLMSDEDYINFVMATHDEHFYNVAERRIKDLVDIYFNFKG